MAKQRILIIEDDMDVAELLLMYFGSQDYEVFHADSGNDGIALARAKLPNLILLDVMLPDMDGFDICYELRNTNLTKYIPTIFLTQRNARADKVSGLELGADDYITKPFDIEELRLRIQGSIQRATRDHLHEQVTGLPTGDLVNDVHGQFKKTDQWNRLDIKVVGFDGFRDAYGFLTANDALVLAANVITEGIVEYGTNNDFVGVIETAHFAALTYMGDVSSFQKAIMDVFAERAKSLYRFEDADRGYILQDEGTSQEKQVPLMHFEIIIENPVNA